MSIVFMTTRHTFYRLDDRPVDEAMSKVEALCEDDGGYGFVGCKGDHGNRTYSWGPDDCWRAEVEDILTAPPVAALITGGAITSKHSNINNAEGGNMNLDDIEDDMEEALLLPVDDNCKKLFSTMSDDQMVSAMAKFRRICGKLKLYCEFFKAKTFKHPDGRPIRENDLTGSLVKVRPCGDKYEGKTYLGIMIGDAALSSSVSIKDDSIVCNWGFMNPAILVPDLGEVIYGCGSWWGKLKDEELTDITEQDIENVWYVRLAKSLSKKGLESEDQTPCNER